MDQLVPANNVCDPQFIADVKSFYNLDVSAIPIQLEKIHEAVDREARSHCAHYNKYMEASQMKMDEELDDAKRKGKNKW